jgi:large subunit ribosomal protein L18
MTTKKADKRDRRHSRIRAKVSGTQERPRLAVFKSNRYVYAQLIDDVAGTTIASATSLGGKLDARSVGKEIAKKAADKGVKKVVFDRGGFIYTGVVAQIAEGAREGGLEF